VSIEHVGIESEVLRLIEAFERQTELEKRYRWVIEGCPAEQRASDVGPRVESEELGAENVTAALSAGPELRTFPTVR
jgi:hypothetical protein